MKKTNLIKILTILLISVMIVSFTTIVNAADEETFDDLTSTEAANNTNKNNTNTNTNNTNTNSNSNKNKNNTNTNNVNTNNTSLYNNTNSDLPKTGIEDSVPIAMLVVVFGISAVYAYKKINEYKNI